MADNNINPYVDRIKYETHATVDSVISSFLGNSDNSSFLSEQIRLPNNLNISTVGEAIEKGAISAKDMGSFVADYAYMNASSLNSDAQAFSDFRGVITELRDNLPGDFKDEFAGQIRTLAHEENHDPDFDSVGTMCVWVADNMTEEFFNNIEATVYSLCSPVIDESESTIPSFISSVEHILTFDGKSDIEPAIQTVTQAVYDAAMVLETRYPGSYEKTLDTLNEHNVFDIGNGKQVTLDFKETLGERKDSSVTSDVIGKAVYEADKYNHNDSSNLVPSIISNNLKPINDAISNAGSGPSIQEEIKNGIIKGIVTIANINDLYSIPPKELGQAIDRSSIADLCGLKEGEAENAVDHADIMSLVGESIENNPFDIVYNIKDTPHSVDTGIDKETPETGKKDKAESSGAAEIEEPESRAKEIASQNESVESKAHEVRDQQKMDTPRSGIDAICDRLDGYSFDDKDLNQNILTVDVKNDLTALKNVISNNGEAVNALFSIYMGSLDNTKTIDKGEFQTIVKGLSYSMANAVNSEAGNTIIDRDWEAIKEESKKDNSPDNLNNTVKDYINNITTVVREMSAYFPTGDEWKPIIEKCMNTISANMEKIPDDIKKQEAESGNDWALFSKSTDAEGNVSFRLNNDLAVRDSGVLADRFGFSVEGQVVARAEGFDSVGQAADALESRIGVFNSMHDIDKGIPKFYSGDIDHLKDAMTRYSENKLDEKTMPMEMKEAMSKYAEATQKLYGITLIDTDKIQDVIDGALGNKDLLNEFSGKVDISPDKEGGFSRASNMIETGQRQETIRTGKGDDTVASKFAVETAAAEAHGRSIIWNPTSNDKINKFIEIRNECIKDSAIFPVYRMNPIYCYSEMRAVLSAAAKGEAINGKVPGVFECYYVINQFAHLNIFDFIIISVIDAIVKAIVGDLNDKVANDSESPTDTDASSKMKEQGGEEAILAPAAEVSKEENAEEPADAAKKETGQADVEANKGTEIGMAPEGTVAKIEVTPDVTTEATAGTETTGQEPEMPPLEGVGSQQNEGSQENSTVTPSNAAGTGATSEIPESVQGENMGPATEIQEGVGITAAEEPMAPPITETIEAAISDYFFNDMSSVDDMLNTVIGTNSDGTDFTIKDAIDGEILSERDFAGLIASSINNVADKLADNDTALSSVSNLINDMGDRFDSNYFGGEVLERQFDPLTSDEAEDIEEKISQSLLNDNQDGVSTEKSDEGEHPTASEIKGIEDGVITDSQEIIEAEVPDVAKTEGDNIEVKNPPDLEAETGQRIEAEEADRGFTYDQAANNAEPPVDSPPAETPKPYSGGVDGSDNPSKLPQPDALSDIIKENIDGDDGAGDGADDDGDPIE